MSRFIFFFNDPKKGKIIQKTIEKGESFTEAINIFNGYPEKIEICFIGSAQRVINYAALMHLDNRITTTRARVKFSDFITIPPVTFEELKSYISSDAKQYEDDFSSIYNSSLEELTLKPNFWETIYNGIISLRSSISADLDLLKQLKVWWSHLSRQKMDQSKTKLSNI